MFVLTPNFSFFSYFSISLNNMISINSKYPSVDCQWAQWQIGDCSETCGNGVRENHRVKLTEALFGGAPCEGEAKATESCNNGICPGTRSLKNVMESPNILYFQLDLKKVTLARLLQSNAALKAEFQITVWDCVWKSRMVILIVGQLSLAFVTNFKILYDDVLLDQKVNLVNIKMKYRCQIIIKN